MACTAKSGKSGSGKQGTGKPAGSAKKPAFTGAAKPFGSKKTPVKKS